MQKKSKIDCWITGAHGFIGRYLARYLGSCGWNVAGIGYGVWAPSEFKAWGLNYWLNGEVGIGNLTQMKRDCGSPKIVFHLAGGSSVGTAMANPMEDFRRTVVSTSSLLEWLRLNAKQSRLVAVSSAALYGGTYAGPISEDALTVPFSTYGSHKLLMEEMCHSYATKYGLMVVLPRLFSVYGCGLRKQLLWDLCEKIVSEKPVELGGSGNELRDWIDVRDVVRGLQEVSKIASTSAPRINLASGKGTTVREVANLVIKSWANSGGVSSKVKFSGCSRPGDPFSLVADIRRIRECNIVPEIPLSTGIADYVAWYRGQRDML